VLTEPELHHGEATVDHLRRALIAVYGTDFGLGRVDWLSRFTDMVRQAVDYRRGRVLLAGDAAHVHPPQGGQGLGIGVQDAVNLGWKLAQVVRGQSPHSLLDTYHAERHPVGERAIRNTMAQVALARPDERHEALREVMQRLLALDAGRREIGALMAGLDIRYDLGGGHPLVGRRVPDVELRTETGTTRPAELLRSGRPVLIDANTDVPVDIGPWTDRVRHVRARCEGDWEVPVLGRVRVPVAVLVRPDGHVAWAGDGGDPDLTRALDRWFGPAA
jgi:3-(3-hydroxy-phenyl)propionate hydroxylase